MEAFGVLIKFIMAIPWKPKYQNNGVGWCPLLICNGNSSCGSQTKFVRHITFAHVLIINNREGAILQSPCLSVRPSVHTFVTDISASTGWNVKWFYIWYMALAWWLVPCLPFPGLPHIYFMFTARLTIFHVCRNENFRNRYLSFYWKKWFYIW